MSTNLSLAAGLANANTTFLARWEDLYATGMQGPFQMWTDEIPGNGASRIELDWLANHPVMQKWQGARQYKNLRHYSQQITYDKYESTLPLKRDLVQYDKTGAVGRAIDTYLSYQISSKDKSVASSFDSASGAGPTGFDGVALFSASHPHAPAAATQSNIGSGTNLSHANLRAAEYAGMLLVHENGEPAKVRYTMMRVGPKLKRRGQELLSADRLQTVAGDQTLDGGTAVAAAARSNVFSGEMTLVVDDRVTNFYCTLIDASKPNARPMIAFTTREPEIIMQTDMGDQRRFDHDEFVWGLEGDWGVAAGHWLTAYRLTGTA